MYIRMRRTFSKRFVGLVALVALTVTSGVAVAVSMLANPGRCVGGDSVEYLELARGLSEQGCFRSLPDHSSPELYRTPGYPLFLALTQPWKSISRFRITLLVQLLLIWLSALLLGHAFMKLEIVDRVGAMATVSLLILNPMVLVLSLQFLTESLFVFSCCVGMWALVQAVIQPRLGFAVISGVAFGTGPLIRPIGLVLLLAIAASLLILRSVPRLRLIRPGLPAMRWSLLLVWILATSALPLAWVVRNGLVAEYWGLSKTGLSFVCSAFGETHLAEGDRANRKTSFDEGKGWPTALGDVAAAVTSYPEESAMAFLSGLGRTALGPGEWTMRRALLGHHGRRAESGPSHRFEVLPESNGIAIVQSPGESPKLSEPRTSAVWLLMLWSFGITVLSYLLLVIGVLRRPFSVHWILHIALLAVAILFVSSSGYQAYARFRVPIIPFVVIGAAFGVSRIVGTRVHRPACCLNSGIGPRPSRIQ